MVVCLGNQSDEGIVYRLQIQGSIEEVKAEAVEISFNCFPTTFDLLPETTLFAICSLYHYC